MSKYLIVLVLLTIFSIVYLKIAEKFNIIDKPNNRSSHTTPTIRGGGILFFIAVLIYFCISNFQNPYFVLGVSLIAIVSFIDDIKTLSASLRLPFQFLAIGLCLFQLGYSLDDFFIIIPLLIIGVGFINIYNFMDGINGITGLYSIVSLVLFLFINLNENLIDNSLIVYPLLSLVVFSFYNFRGKARMFAGDIGSISIAVILFFIGFYFIRELNAPILLLSMLVYGADSVLTLLYRKSIGEKITEPHRQHIYQKMVHVLKLSHLKVSLVYFVLQLIINFIIYFGYKSSMVYQLIIILSSILVFIILYLSVFKYIEKRKVKTS